MANSGPNGEWWPMPVGFWDELLRKGGPILGWSIWYADGTVVRSTEMSWEAAPRLGVQVIATYHGSSKGVNWHSHFDEYCMPGEETTKLGLEIDFATFMAILRAAEADPWRP